MFAEALCAVHLRRLHHHGAGSHRHGQPAPAPCRQRGAEGEVPGPGDRRRADHGRRHHRARRRLRRDGHPHHGATRGRRMGAQRHQDVHHQRRARRPVLRRRQDRHRQASTCSMFIVEKGTPGFTVRRARSTSTGWRSSDTAELFFDDCRIPAENLLGQEGSGFYAIMKNFQNERTVIGAMAIGESQAAIDLTLDYVTTRKAFGAPLWEKQTIRQRLVDAGRRRVEAGRQLDLPRRLARHAGLDATVQEVSMVKALTAANWSTRSCTPACSSTAAWATCARARSSA